MTDTSMAQASTQGAVHLTTQDFAETVKTSGKPVFIDFFATWCGPCKMAAPVVEKLAGKYAGKMVIAKLDVDENREIAQQYGVMSIPTVLILKQDGDKVVELAREIGFPGEARYEQMIGKVLGSDAPAMAKAA